MSEWRKATRAIWQSIAALAVLSGAAAAQSADVDAGERVFKKCKICHMVGAEAKKRTGPPLNNIIGARAGFVAEYIYSAALIAAGEAGLRWDAEALDAFLADPKGTVAGTKMTYRGLKSASDRANVIAYLATFAGGDMSVTRDAGFIVSADVLAIEGDRDWGEYLSSECTTCHRPDGSNDGIPGITGWENEPFVTAMHAYRAGQREHPVMQMIAGRLSDEEIAGLAEYFQSLN